MPSTHSFIILYGFLLSLSAQATETKPHCYLFKPGSVEAVPLATESTLTDAETWCYQTVTTPKAGTLIYNVTQGSVKPELTLFVGSDGFVVHSSLLDGKLTTHRVKASEYNPFSVPLEEPHIGQRMSVGLSDSTVKAAQANLSALMASEQTDTTVAISEGQFSVQASVLPWRGYWYPQRGQTIAPSLRKYDAYVKARTGVNPNTVGYERRHHGWTGEVWEGHCNGWAAAAILNVEPQKPKTDPISGITFSVLDQKALLMERDFCVTHTFFGSRYRGEGDNMSDIRPASFHKTLVYYIGQLKKPVATDYRRDATVDNAVISGYDMTVKKTGSRTYRVTTIVRLHHYDKKKITSTGIAPSERRTYRYNLKVNDVGEIIGGSWLSGNPDFLWVPLSSVACSKNNQKLQSTVIEEILNMQ